MREALLLIGIRCEWIGGKSFAFALRDPRRRRTTALVVEATTVQVCYDYAAKRRRSPMPDGPAPACVEAFEGRTLARAAKTAAT